MGKTNCGGGDWVCRNGGMEVVVVTIEGFLARGA